MKKSILASALLFVAVTVSFSFKNVDPLDQITICHTPPGNPDNCHEITISLNAAQTHRNHHGDRLICRKLSDWGTYTGIGKDLGLPVILEAGN